MNICKHLVSRITEPYKHKTYAHEGFRSSDTLGTEWGGGENSIKMSKRGQQDGSDITAFYLKMLNV